MPPPKLSIADLNKVQGSQRASDLRSMQAREKIGVRKMERTGTCLTTPQAPRSVCCRPIDGLSGPGQDRGIGLWCECREEQGFEMAGWNDSRFVSGGPISAPVKLYDAARGLRLPRTGRRPARHLLPRIRAAEGGPRHPDRGSDGHLRDGAGRPGVRRWRASRRSISRRRARHKATRACIGRRSRRRSGLLRASQSGRSSNGTCRRRATGS